MRWQQLLRAGGVKPETSSYRDGAEAVAFCRLRVKDWHHLLLPEKQLTPCLSQCSPDKSMCRVKGRSLKSAGLYGSVPESWSHLLEPTLLLPDSAWGFPPAPATLTASSGRSFVW